MAALLRCGAATRCSATTIRAAPQPSRADLQMTRALQDLLQPLSIRLRDHVIVAGASACSLTQSGLIDS